MNYKKTGVLAGLVAGAGGLLLPLSEAGASGLLPPDHYCPITGIPVNGGCSLSGPTHIESADAAASAQPKPRKYDVNRGTGNAGAGNMGSGTGNAGVHGGAASNNNGGSN